MGTPKRKVKTCSLIKHNLLAIMLSRYLGLTVYESRFLDLNFNVGHLALMLWVVNMRGLVILMLESGAM